MSGSTHSVRLSLLGATLHVQINRLKVIVTAFVKLHVLFASSFLQAVQVSGGL